MKQRTVCSCSTKYHKAIWPIATAAWSNVQYTDCKQWSHKQASLLAHLCLPVMIMSLLSAILLEHIATFDTSWTPIVIIWIFYCNGSSSCFLSLRHVHFVALFVFMAKPRIHPSIYSSHEISSLVPFWRWHCDFPLTRMSAWMQHVRLRYVGG